MPWEHRPVLDRDTRSCLQTISFSFAGETNLAVAC
jgi:hypothetical protein